MIQFEKRSDMVQALTPSLAVKDADAMIEATARLLMEQRDGEVQSHGVVLPARLVVRSSSAHRNIVEVPT